MLTSDPSVLDMGEHFHIKFINDSPPCQPDLICHAFRENETIIIDREIEKLLSQKVIEQAEFAEDRFISPVFIRQKKNGEFRLILNLKKLNEFITYNHFKMETFEIALTMITKDMSMCSLDIRHAYYSVPVAIEHRKYLCFVWKEQIYEFTCPNGLSCMLLKFTKLLKPVYAKLRTDGHVCTGFTDDSLLGGNNERECSNTFETAGSLMKSLGFLLNLKKSITVPTKKLCYLGNNIDSEKMLVTLPVEKMERIEKEFRNFYQKQHATIRKVAQIIGIIVSSFSAVEYAKLHYRELERNKISALKRHYGDYETEMLISESMKCELKWWFTNIHTQYRRIDKGNPEICVITDASLLGWGGCLSKFKNWWSLD